jgi:hypothetical protein
MSDVFTNQEVLAAHANARLNLHGRRLLVERVIQHGRPVAHVAKELGVSRQCAHRWVARSRAEGEAGLRDRSSRPTVVPGAPRPGWSSGCCGCARMSVGGRTGSDPSSGSRPARSRRSCGATGCPTDGLAYWLYLTGLRRVSASVAGSFITLVPVFGAQPAKPGDGRGAGGDRFGTVDERVESRGSSESGTCGRSRGQRSPLRRRTSTAFFSSSRIAASVSFSYLARRTAERLLTMRFRRSGAVGAGGGGGI